MELCPLQLVYVMHISLQASKYWLNYSWLLAAIYVQEIRPAKKKYYYWHIISYVVFAAEDLERESSHS